MEFPVTIGERETLLWVGMFRNGMLNEDYERILRIRYLIRFSMEIRQLPRCGGDLFRIAFNTCLQRMNIFTNYT